MYPGHLLGIIIGVCPTPVKIHGDGGVFSVYTPICVHTPLTSICTSWYTPLVQTRGLLSKKSHKLCARQSQDDCLTWNMLFVEGWTYRGVDTIISLLCYHYYYIYPPRYRVQLANLPGKTLCTQLTETAKEVLGCSCAIKLHLLVNSKKSIYNRFVVSLHFFGQGSIWCHSGCKTYKDMDSSDPPPTKNYISMSLW